MNDLAQFLRDRYTEQRALAEAASPGPWQVNPDDPDDVLAADGIVAAEAFALSGNQQRNTAQFIAANNPAYVLSDLDAKLAVLDWHHPERDDVTPWGKPVQICRCGYDLPCSTQRQLAQPFAGHPKFKEEWTA